MVFEAWVALARYIFLCQAPLWVLLFGLVGPCSRGGIFGGSRTFVHSLFNPCSTSVHPLFIGRLSNLCSPLVQVNTDATVAIVAEITSSLDSGATAEWGLTEGILNGYEDLSSAVVSSLGYTVSHRRFRDRSVDSMCHFLLRAEHSSHFRQWKLFRDDSFYFLQSSLLMDGAVNRETPPLRLADEGRTSARTGHTDA